MESNEGLPLVQWVRDYAMSGFTQYNLGEMDPALRYALFHDSLMGQFFVEKLTNKESYLSKLIDKSIREGGFEGLESVIKFGYEAVSGYKAG